MTTINNCKPIRVKRTHEVTGHTTVNESIIVMKYLGYDVTQVMKPCSADTESQSKQKNLPIRVVSR